VLASIDREIQGMDNLDDPLRAAPDVGDDLTTEILKVRATTRPTATAGAIAGIVREGGAPEVQAIGAAAVNQAVKAVLIARAYLLQDGLDLYCVPGFAEVSIAGEERTGVRLRIEGHLRLG
jgi:stage V sporulation protein S